MTCMVQIVKGYSGLGGIITVLAVRPVHLNRIFVELPKHFKFMWLMLGEGPDASHRNENAESPFFVKSI